MLPRFDAGGLPMRYKVGAEQLQQVPTLVHRPDTAFRASRTAPAGPTHAVSVRTGEAACGIIRISPQALYDAGERGALAPC